MPFGTQDASRSLTLHWHRLPTLEHGLPRPAHQRHPRRRPRQSQKSPWTYRTSPACPQLRHGGENSTRTGVRTSHRSPPAPARSARTWTSIPRPGRQLQTARVLAVALHPRHRLRPEVLSANQTGITPRCLHCSLSVRREVQDTQGGFSLRVLPRLRQKLGHRRCDLRLDLHQSAQHNPSPLQCLTPARRFLHRPSHGLR